ncbi:MAG: glycosyltransferase family 39 protein [Planctomycetes bacterium]|nr:glycosyltransferase family 39 protein [Planctomycetota bacterium]
MLTRALVLLLLTAIACLPVWMLPELDGTEGRRVQIAVEMVARGDWLVPTLGHEPTWAKPPLHYWLLATILQWFGDHPMLLRLPSVLGAWFAAWLAGELLRRWFGPVAGWIGALGIACAPLVVFTWPTAEIDPLFASLVATSLTALATGVARDQRLLVVASGLLAGLAMLQKGPPLFLFGLGAYLVWWRERRLRYAWQHFVPMLGVALAYYVPLWLLRVDPSAMLAVANEESVGRVKFFEWQHVRAVPEFWLRAVAIQLPLGWWAFREWRGARRAPVDRAPVDAGDLTLRMASGAVVVAVAVLTFFPGRATRYLLPNVLLLAFAVAPAVARFVALAGPLSPRARGGLRVVAGLGGLAACVLPFVPSTAIGLGSVAFAVVAAVGALAVRTPRALVVFCLALPLVAAWTVGLDRTLQWSEGRRARRPAAEVLRAEMARLGVPSVRLPRPEDLQTVGHFDSVLLLELGVLPHGDELLRRPVVAHWVLHEVGGLPPVQLDDYVERVRVSLPFKSFVLAERVGRR